MERRYSDLVIEVTRRCNQTCKDFCMRGPQQNLDITYDDIDLFLDLDRNHYKKVSLLFFSGGEPTLNPEAIHYCIDKIIGEKLPIYSVGLFTNGLIYSDSIVEDFNRYNEYYKEYILPELMNMTKLPVEVMRQLALKGSFITFSNDKYHLPISPEVVRLYQENGYGIEFDYTGDRSVEKGNLLNAGFSQQGRELLPEDNCIRMFGDSVIDTIYLTAKGNLSCYGDGSYEFIDSISKDYPVSQYTLEQFCLANVSNSSRDYDDSDRKSFVFFKKR